MSAFVSIAAALPDLDALRKSATASPTPVQTAMVDMLQSADASLQLLIEYALSYRFSIPSRTAIVDDEFVPPLPHTSTFDARLAAFRAAVQQAQSRFSALQAFSDMVKHLKSLQHEISLLPPGEAQYEADASLHVRGGAHCFSYCVCVCVCE